jgi:hypothetical protein
MQPDDEPYVVWLAELMLWSLTAFLEAAWKGGSSNYWPSRLQDYGLVACQI